MSLFVLIFDCLEMTKLEVLFDNQTDGSHIEFGNVSDGLFS